MGGACSSTGERRGACRVLAGKPERKRNLEKPGVDVRIILKLSSGNWIGSCI
jgi:hypothetical protein